MNPEACAVVLAGGRGARFGGDKALASFGGEPLLARAVRLLRGLGFAQVVVAAREAGGREIAGAEVVLDGTAQETPLAGLRAGLRAARFELVFACAADMPFAADAALIDALARAIEGHAAAVPLSAGVEQPLASLWRREPSLAAADALLAGPASPGVKALVRAVKAVRLAWPDPRPFLDADTPAALAQLERAL